MTDERLLRQLQARQQDALEDLMEKYRRYVYTVIANVLGSSGTHADAEELTSDTFYSVWSHADTIKPGKLKAYLAVTARNKAKSFLRSSRPLPMDLDTIELPDDGNSLEDTVMQADLQRRIQKALHKMRPKDREIFLRHYYYLQTSEQIALVMGIPSSTVRTRLARGRKILKEILSKEELP
jgi:RNA polymerase sigma-70 factor (ECF subfamily)